MSKTWERWQYIQRDEAIKLLDTIEEQLKTKFAELRDQRYNPNTKGYDYEEIVKEFFEAYVGGAFELLIRVGLLDVELKVLSVLKPSENEFDVVALYKNAVPRLVQHRLVPYDSVAFIIEVKQTLTLPNLEADLLKLSKLDELQITPERICSNTGFFTQYQLKRPIRLLFYYEVQADMEKVYETLSGKYANAWDICVILTENVVFTNSTLPFVKQNWTADYFSQSPNHALTKAMFFTCAFIQNDYVNSWLIFWNLFRSSLETEK
jgi:hypothetical protein